MREVSELDYSNHRRVSVIIYPRNRDGSRYVTVRGNGSTLRLENIFLEGKMKIGDSVAGYTEHGRLRFALTANRIYVPA